MSDSSPARARSLPFKLRLDAEDKAARAPLVPFDGDRASKEAKAQIADFGFFFKAAD